MHMKERKLHTDGLHCIEVTNKFFTVWKAWYIPTHILSSSKHGRSSSLFYPLSSPVRPSTNSTITVDPLRKLI